MGIRIYKWIVPQNERIVPLLRYYFELMHYRNKKWDLHSFENTIEKEHIYTFGNTIEI